MSVCIFFQFFHFYFYFLFFQTSANTTATQATSPKRTFEDFSDLPEVELQKIPRILEDPSVESATELDTEVDFSDESSSDSDEDSCDDSVSIGSSDSTRSEDSRSSGSLRDFVVQDRLSDLELSSSESESEEEFPVLSGNARSNFVPVSFIDYCSAFFSVDEPSSTVPSAAPVVIDLTEDSDTEITEFTPVPVCQFIAPQPPRSPEYVVRTYSADNVQMLREFHRLNPIWRPCIRRAMESIVRNRDYDQICCPVLMNRVIAEEADTSPYYEGYLNWTPIPMLSGCHQGIIRNASCEFCGYDTFQ
jgi:hypothetical protein